MGGGSEGGGGKRGGGGEGGGGIVGGQGSDGGEPGDSIIFLSRLRAHCELGHILLLHLCGIAP